MSDLARGLLNTKSKARPLFLQTRGSVWNSTKLPIAVFTGYGFLIYLLHRAGYVANLGRGAQSLSGVISLIVGLLISFRSSSSSERWHEGRRLWASLTSSTRSLLVTLSLSLPPTDKSQRGSNIQQDSVRELFSLIVAYSYAVRHHLREDDPLQDPDFCRLLPTKLLYSFQSAPQARRTVSFKPEDNTADEKFERVLNDRQYPLETPKQVRATKAGGPTNMPLFLLRQIQSLLNSFRTTTAPSIGSPAESSPLLETPTWGNCLAILKEMTEQLTQLERIRDTPIPLALGIHVQQMLILHCLSLPPQLVSILDWWVVPVSAVIAWTFGGVEVVAGQLSNPFGKDANDLPLETYVQDIHMEYLEIVGDGIGVSVNDALLTLPDSVSSTSKEQ